MPGTAPEAPGPGQAAARASARRLPGGEAPETGHARVATSVKARRRVAIAGHAGDEATARAGLAAAAGDVRASALVALARLGKLGDGDLLAALGDGSASVRRRACELAGQYGLAAAAGPGLVDRLSDRDVGVVEAACYALGELAACGAQGDATCRALAAVAGGHPEPLCREAAVAALGALGHPDGLVAVLAACHDKPAVRRRAVIALAAFEGTEVDQALAAALSDPDWQVRQAAEDLIGRAGPDR